MNTLTEDTFTFGRYKGQTLSVVLKDRPYCKWLTEQSWMYNDYEYLFNRLTEYKPIDFFVKETATNGIFLDTYQYFNLKEPTEVNLELSEAEIECYTYYLAQIEQLKQQIYNRLEDELENPYDITAPTNWLQRFEIKSRINRSFFKEFINSYELPNIPYIVERIKKEGGIEYKGAKSFIIAKERSLKQEQYWEDLLKNKYGENLAVQFSYESCMFDFLIIKQNTIIECKLGIKDFNEEQYRRYKLALRDYNIIYLISNDCVINTLTKEIFTTNPDKYKEYISKINLSKKTSYMDRLIIAFTLTESTDLLIHI